MATYSSFKKIDTDALVDGTLVAADIAADTVPNTAISANAVPSSAISGTVTSAKLASSIDLSAKTVTYRSIVDGDISASAGIAGSKLASGAATTNLGYTPVNAAGDTMSGTLTLAGGSASSPSIARAGNTNTGINFSSNTVDFITNGSVQMQFDSGGRVRRPNHPAFAAAGTNGWLYASNYGGTGYREVTSQMGWTTSHQTGGTNFDSNNGRFTAPVTGYYVFHTHWYLLNDNNSTPSYVHLFFSKNSGIGWTQSGRAPYVMNMHGNRNNYDDGASYSCVMPLNAGEYCSLGIVWHSYNSRQHCGHQIFSGYLIG